MHYLFCPFHEFPKADNGGCAVLQPGWHHPRRKLDSSVILLGRKGTVQLMEENVPLEVRPNRLVLLTAGRLHDGTNPIYALASYYWLHFTLPGPPALLSNDEVAPILSNPMIIKQRLAGAALIPQQIDLPDSDWIFSLFRDLQHEQEHPGYTPWRFQLLFQNLLIAITEATIHYYQPPDTLTAGSSLVYGAVSSITTCLTDPNLSIKTIADLLQHNPDYIGRQFRSVMGMSVGNYILQQRMKLAQQLLQETPDSVAAIALKCGFTSMRHFLRQFKRERGITPSELRRKHRAMHINIQ